MAWLVHLVSCIFYIDFKKGLSKQTKPEGIAWPGLCILYAGSQWFSIDEIQLVI